MCCHLALLICTPRSHLCHCAFVLMISAQCVYRICASSLLVRTCSFCDMAFPRLCVSSLQSLWPLRQTASTEHTCTLIFFRTETGTATPAIGEEHKAEPDARPLRLLRLPRRAQMQGSIVSPRLEPVRQRQRLIVLEPDARRPDLWRGTSFMQKRWSRTPARRTWSLWSLHHSAVVWSGSPRRGCLSRKQK